MPIDRLSVQRPRRHLWPSSPVALQEHEDKVGLFFPSSSQENKSFIFSWSIAAYSAVSFYCSVK